MQGKSLDRGFNQSSLRAVLVVFFLALIIPAAALVYQAYSQLKWEAFHQYRLMAGKQGLRIDQNLADLISRQETHSFADYSFLVVAGDPRANFLQRSTLSTFPVDSAFPGLLAYFQVDTDGTFSSPLLPRDDRDPQLLGISPQEFSQRLALQKKLQDILTRNRLVSPRRQVSSAAAEGLIPTVGYNDEEKVREPNMAEADKDIQAQAAFDRLEQSYREDEQGKVEAAAYARVEDLQLDPTLASQSRERQTGAAEERSLANSAPPSRSKRKEMSALPETARQLMPRTLAAPSTVSKVQVSTFESEIDPYQFSLLDSGDFVLYRKVWRGGQRYIQGAVIEQQAFLRGMILDDFDRSALADVSELTVAYAGNVMATGYGHSSGEYLDSSRELSGALLYRTRLSAPLGGLELIFSVTRLPAGQGGALLAWVSLALLIVLCGGFYLIYRLGLSQIALTRQQQDFVSAVSHELKTPLTSIRMYGEMLLSGWADEDKKQSYYAFIHDESERLSRLINNVLQLAQLSRNKPQFELKQASAAELLDLLESRVATQAERAGFELNVNCEEPAKKCRILVDADSFTQIMINLVDNAIKFSSRATEKTIEIGCRETNNKALVFTVRDYGPGIPAAQMRKIFTLFYRSESELTRETVGTGIGLALVQELVSAMHGKIDVHNREPGAEFSVSFPLASANEK
jgi:signal transduction histidine kinase